MRTALLVVLVLAVSASSLDAQHRRRGIRDAGPDGRSGFWAVLTGGAGVEQVNFEDDGLGFSDPLTRPVVGVRLGGTLSPNWRLGAEVNGWVNERGPFTETVGGMEADYGGAASVGLGWDVRLARHLYLVPSVDFANYQLDAGGGGSYRERITTFGLGLAYQR